MAPFKGLSVTQKIFFSVALTALLLTSGLGYSLWLQQQQLHQVEALVEETFAQHNALLELSQTLAAQSRLERQYSLTSESALLELQYHRRTQLQELSRTLADRQEELSALPHYSDVVEEGLVLQRDGRKEIWEDLLKRRIGPLRKHLEQQIENLRQELEQQIRESGTVLREQFRRNLGRAIGWSAISLLLGLGLMAQVILYIYRAMSELKAQTRHYAKGRFGRERRWRGNDEFVQLQTELQQMGAELEELQRQQLDANPLTHLPGNRAIQQEIEKRFSREEPFAHVYIDLDDFKAYNDRYGYQAGSAVIAETASVLRQSVELTGDPGTFIGHIGGDDYVAILTPGKAVKLARMVAEEFDRRAPWFYDEEDRKAGFISGQDRFGVERKFPIMTVSIAVALSDHLQSPTVEAISEECAAIKHQLKKKPGSNVGTNAD